MLRESFAESGQLVIAIGKKKNLIQQIIEALESMLKRFELETHDSRGCMFKNCELCKAHTAIKAAKGKP